ncbi:ABC transporter substrate-binding protein [Oharaeibacter diazotrophicus]|uniref:Spermidine/putrescine transport system substrate-binding protein n=1 Tax=Oharaeibacter diazotrophicus TaxID=1920512 RepID=A0A4R6R8S0_9HYPH|nr:ABC transporter substrate-binding protein [Oharaeibacter diazotrophicus]TDP82433.1 spermidine/putrescine transport system substrate-binding protein [Oharaeibacter diazotrophicus]BBE72804.1 spermidine/putrescine-binding periplasmic protein precursor [Pleomorphomonas sp. SM30]GLS76842.1 spermidine/putrescine ABC transporter [Oharaeibacter diazotrophicus]
MTETKKGSALSHVLAAALVSVAVLAPAAAEAAGKLTYFTWSGYELPEFHQGFLAAHPDGVEVSTFGDDDDAFTKVKAGFRPDVAHPCYDKIARWNKEGLLQPIEIARIANWEKIFPVFRDLPDIQAGPGKVWMVPWDWGNTSILYRTDLVDKPEASWNLLWNPAYAGRMATIDAVHDTPVVAALLSGVSPFDMTAAEMDKVADKLREQRPLLSSYTTDMTSVEQSLASGELVAAMTWNASAVALKKQGVPVEFMKPKEGMLTWACGFVMLKDSANVDLAYDFINARLDPSSGKKLIEDYGYGASTATAFAEVPKETLENLQLPADPDAALKTTVFTGPMKQADELAKMFEKVKAGG